MAKGAFRPAQAARHLMTISNRLFFFFKQKTAYEIHRYWSSDVCSSDLNDIAEETGAVPGGGSCIFMHIWEGLGSSTVGCTALDKDLLTKLLVALPSLGSVVLAQMRSEERRVGKGGRCRGARHRYKEKIE